MTVAISNLKAVNPQTGLSGLVTELVRQEVNLFPEVKATYLFGSRARGDWSPRSDVDVAIDAPSMTTANFAKLWSAIDALPIAYPIDCVWLQALPASPLKRMIERDALAL